MSYWMEVLREAAVGFCAFILAVAFLALPFWWLHRIGYIDLDVLTGKKKGWLAEWWERRKRQRDEKRKRRSPP